MSKLFLIFAVVLAVTTTFVRAKAGNVTIKWIEQKLDHFNKNENKTWRMRYMANDGFYVPGGPLFIVVGGGSLPDSPISILEGLFYDTAREHNALLLQTEHRFYGESRPVKDMMTNENLQYLDTQQSLADLAHFIRTIKSSSPSMNKSKVILAGDHYSGALVTWFKKLYPDLAVGCWASGAPLFAKADFKEYKEAIGQSIRLVGGDSCYNRLANGVKDMEKMLTKNKFPELKCALKVCNTFDENSELDVAALSSYVFNAIAVQVYYHENNKIQSFCKKLMQESDDLKSLSNLVLMVYGNTNCNNFTYKNDGGSVEDTSFGYHVERQWYYRLCNEFGWFYTTTSTQQPFGTKMPLSVYYKACKEQFGDKFTPQYIQSQINKTNQLFGGFNPQVENVYMTYGQMDPWLSVGIQDKDKATIIPMESYASNVGSISDKDSKDLKAAKIKLKELIKMWLKN